MNRRNIFGALAAFAAVPAAADVVCVPVQTPPVVKRGLLVTMDMDFAMHCAVYLNGVRQTTAIMAQEGEHGFVIRFARDEKGHLIDEPGLGLKHEFVQGKVELDLDGSAPDWAYKMLGDARELWA